jgi:hypothetical protein
MLYAYVGKLKSNGYGGGNMKAIIWIGGVLATLAGIVGLLLLLTSGGRDPEINLALTILGAGFVFVLLLALVHGVMQIRDLLKDMLVTRAVGK